VEKIAYRPEALTKVPFTYCPGCLHGVAHRLVAEAIDEHGLINQMTGVAPVGCSVFAYKFFNMGYGRSCSWPGSGCGYRHQTGSSGYARLHLSG